MQSLPAALAMRYYLIPGTDYAGLDVEIPGLGRLRAWQSPLVAGLILYEWGNPRFPVPPFVRPPDRSGGKKKSGPVQLPLPGPIPVPHI
jgi:hypothetical protein